MRRLFTIGYEGASLDDFIKTLEIAGVDLLLDVRELPMSRRKGFSKTALGEAVAGAGMEYRHEKKLGSPKSIRHRLYADGDYVRFFQDFRTYLKTQSELLTELANELSGNVALMCYERDPNTCHRTAVAEAFETMLEIAPKHLGVQKDAAKQEHDAPCAHPGQSFSTA